MHTIRNRAGLLAVALLLAVAGVALAEVVQENYKPVRQHTSRGAPGFYRTALDGSDSETYSATPVDPQPVGGDTTLVVVTRHTVGSTAQVEVGLYTTVSGGTYSFMGVADVQTASASQKTDGTGWLPVRPLYFPLNGAQAYDVRVTDVSSGTVDVKAWTIGAASAAAE